jgi:hypothetical protein
MLMVKEDDEMTRFRHVAEMLHGVVDSQKISMLGAVFLLCRVELLGGVCDECKWRGWVGCASRLARDRLALHSPKALWRSGVQMIV